MINVHQMKKNSLIFAPKTLLLSRRSFPGKTELSKKWNGDANKEKALGFFAPENDLTRQYILFPLNSPRFSDDFRRNRS